MKLTHPRNPIYERWRWQIFAVTWIAYAGFYLTRKSYSVAKIGLSEDFGFSNTDLGYFDNVYLWTYMIGQFVWGVSGDRFGPRRIVLAGLFCSSAVGFVSGWISALWVFAAFGALQGIAQSTGWPNLVKTMSEWFSRSERGVIMGWWCSNYAVGGLIASPFAGLAADTFGSWRYAFFVPALALFGIVVLFFLFQRNRPEDVGLPSIEEYHGEKPAVLDENERPEEEPEGSWKVVGEVFRNKTVWVLAIVYFCLKPTRYAILFWGPKYVSEQLGTGMTESALISILFEAAGPLGVLFAGVMSDKVFQARRMPIAVIMLFLLAGVLFNFNEIATGGKGAVACLLFAIGFLLYGPDSLLTGTSAMDFGTKKGAATAAGFINGWGSVGAALGGGLPGYISDNYGWEPLFNGLAGASILAALILLPLWNARPATVDNSKKT